MTVGAQSIGNCYVFMMHMLLSYHSSHRSLPSPFFFLNLQSILKSFNNRVFSVLLVAVSLLVFGFHSYYVTITDVEYNATSKVMEMSMKFTAHDLEHALEHKGVPEMHLGEKNELLNSDSIIESYIKNSFSIQADGRIIAYKMIGKELKKDDVLYCFLESDTLASPQVLTIRNSILTEYTEKQVNRVNVKIGNYSHAITLGKDHLEEEIKIEKQ